MATTHDAHETHRPRRSRVSVEVRPMLATLSDGEFQQRERQLEYLIVLAACRRAARRSVPARRTVSVDDAAAAVR